MNVQSIALSISCRRCPCGTRSSIHTICICFLTFSVSCVIRGQQEEIIPAEEVRVGEILRVLPGETASVDGEILSGQTLINQAVMTGESLPVDNAPALKRAYVGIAMGGVGSDIAVDAADIVSEISCKYLVITLSYIWVYLKKGTDRI